jgi:hypothetical protein
MVPRHTSVVCTNQGIYSNRGSDCIQKPWKYVLHSQYTEFARLFKTPSPKYF